MKVLSGEGIKDFALLGIFQIVRGQLVQGQSTLRRKIWIKQIKQHAD